jgi:hypothetical protein
MTLDWLNQFHRKTEKPADYAEKTLAAYSLGMRAKGSIAGVRLLSDPQGCAACQQLDPGTVFHPDAAPHLPLSDCDQGLSCRCVYRPVMTYQIEERESSDQK